MCAQIERAVCLTADKALITSLYHLPTLVAHMQEVHFHQSLQLPRLLSPSQLCLLHSACSPSFTYPCNIFSSFPLSLPCVLVPLDVLLYFLLAQKCCCYSAQLNVLHLDSVRTHYPYLPFVNTLKPL